MSNGSGDETWWIMDAANTFNLYLAHFAQIAHRKIRLYSTVTLKIVKGEGLPQLDEVAQGVPGRLRPRIFLTFATTRVVGRQPYAPAGFTPGEIPDTHF
jgi:hypothetical protein